MSPSLPVLYAIQASAELGGMISPGGGLDIEAGTNKTFTITPDPGYSIQDVVVDGVSVTAVATYTFVAVAADHTIDAKFVVVGGASARPDAQINRIIDEVIVTLQQINGTASRWLTKPRTVIRHTSNPYKENMPAMIVTCTAWGSNEPMSSGIHRASATIEVRCLTQYDTAIAKDDPHRALHRIAADAMSAIQANWQLGGVLSRGYIHVIEGYIANKELDAVSGFAECALQFKAEWSWEHTAP